MESQDSKTQDATPFKLEEARKKGQVGKSQELTSLAVLSIVAILFFAQLSSLCIELIKSTKIFLSSTKIFTSNLDLVGPFWLSTYQTVFIKLAAILFSAVLAAIVISYIQTGLVFSFFPLKPDFTRLNPKNGFKKIFSKRNLVDFIKLCVKVPLFIVVVYILWSQLKSGLLRIDSFAIYNQVHKWRSALISLTVAIVAVMVLSALFDLWYSKFEYSKKMRMSTRDLKDEFKRREGDPEIKAKRRRNLITLIKQFSGLSKVKDADVLITNPTHIAIALRYRAASMAYPIVVAKGKGVFASLIIRSANKHQVPVFRKPALARALYKSAQTNKPIPSEKYLEVAEIYREVIKANSEVLG